MKRGVLLIPLVFAATVSIHAQSVSPGTLNATGGTAVIGGNEFDWSVGEMTMVSTFSGSSIVVTQGVLQPYESIALGVVNDQKLARNLQVFPNPATSVVNLQYASAVQGRMSYRLMDMAGKVIKSSMVDVKQGTTTEQINVSALANASYMLEVIINPGKEGAESASYKIQKLK